MFRFSIYYYFTDPYTSDHDYEGIEHISACSEGSAISLFRAEHPESRYSIQCIGKS